MNTFYGRILRFLVDENDGGLTYIVYIIINAIHKIFLTQRFFSKICLSDPVTYRFSGIGRSFLPNLLF